MLQVEARHPLLWCPFRPVVAYFPDNDRRSIHYPLLNVIITLYIEGKIALFVIKIFPLAPT